MKKAKRLYAVLPFMGLLFSCATSSSSSSPSASAASSSSEASSSSASSSIASSSQASSSALPSSSSGPSMDLAQTPLDYTLKDFAAHSAYALDYCPSLGSPKILVVPVWFTDSSSFIPSSQKEALRQDIADAFFGDEEDTGWESVASYFEEASFGNLTLEGEVTPWYEVNVASVDCGEGQTEAIATNVVAAYKKQFATSMEDFDLDANGYLDGVCLIYAAPDGNEYSQGNSNLWAYTTWTLNETNRRVGNPGLNGYLWASYDFLYGLSSYAIGSYGGGDNRYARLDPRTYIHEMGHMLGLSDYYDYSGYCLPSGGAIMQDHDVGGEDPYSCLSLGWCDPYIPFEETTVVLRPFETSGDVLLLSNSLNPNSPFDEYLLVEYYGAQGLNAFDAAHAYRGSSYYSVPSEMGLRVWHVDGRLVRYANGNPSASTITSNPLSGNDMLRLTTNTYPADGTSSGRLSPLGGEYNEFDELHFLRANLRASRTSDSEMSSHDFFEEGDSFSVAEYSRQFPLGTTLDDGSEPLWSFYVESLDENQAVLSLSYEG